MTTIPVVALPTTDPSTCLYVSAGSLVIERGNENDLLARALPAISRYQLVLLEPRSVFLGDNRPQRRLRVVDDSAWHPRRDHFAELLRIPAPDDGGDIIKLAAVLQLNLNDGTDHLLTLGETFTVRSHRFELLLDPQGTPVLRHLGHADPSKGPTQ